jgi:hypothetical protein
MNKAFDSICGSIWGYQMTSKNDEFPTSEGSRHRPGHHSRRVEEDGCRIRTGLSTLMVVAMLALLSIRSAAAVMLWTDAAVAGNPGNAPTTLDLGDGNPTEPFVGKDADDGVSTGTLALSNAGTIVYELSGAGIDAVDDGDGFEFEVAAGHIFDFFLTSPAAEFKWLSTGTARSGDVATNFTNGDISVTGLGPGYYSSHWFYNGSGTWSARITVTSVPEPGSFTLSVVGMIGVCSLVWRRRRLADRPPLARFAYA